MVRRPCVAWLAGVLGAGAFLVAAVYWQRPPFLGVFLGVLPLKGRVHAALRALTIHGSLTDTQKNTQKRRPRGRVHAPILELRRPWLARVASPFSFFPVPNFFLSIKPQQLCSLTPPLFFHVQHSKPLRRDHYSTSSAIFFFAPAPGHVVFGFPICEDLAGPSAPKKALEAG